MSKIFEEKRKLTKYFEDQSRMHARLAEYSLIDKRFVGTPSKKSMVWSDGVGGIPISWDDATDSVFCDSSDSHSLIIGPTGSKKSRLVAIPTVELLCSAKESMIISDPKSEIYERTAALLEENGYHVCVLNLRSPSDGSCWNPLSIPYRFYVQGELDKAYEFVNDISENLTKADASTKDPFWDNSAGSLFFGLTLLLFLYCRDSDEASGSEKYVTIDNLLRLRFEMFRDGDAVKNSNFWYLAQSDEFIRNALVGTVETADVTRGGILSTFDEKMRRFSIQPNLMDMLSRDDIALDILHQEPSAIFLLLPDEKTSYHKLVSLFIKQSYEFLIYQAQKRHKPMNANEKTVRINYILDEFSSLPTIKDFPAMITAARSRNIRFNLFVQSKHQLVLRYGEEAETIQTNCNNLLVLSGKELRLLEDVSKLCGDVIGDFLVRPVFAVSELRQLDKGRGEILVFSGSNKPLLTRLPDINQYDNGRARTIPIPQRYKQEKSTLTFSEVTEADEEKIDEDNDESPVSQEDQILPPPPPVLDADSFDIQDSRALLQKLFDESDKRFTRNRPTEAINPNDELEGE